MLVCALAPEDVEVRDSAARSSTSDAQAVCRVEADGDSCMLITEALSCPDSAAPGVPARCVIWLDGEGCVSWACVERREMG